MIAGWSYATAHDSPPATEIPARLRRPGDCAKMAPAGIPGVDAHQAPHVKSDSVEMRLNLADRAASSAAGAARPR